MQQNAGKTNYFVYLYKANTIFCILQLSAIAPKQPLARIKYLPPKEQLMNNKATFGTTKCAEYFTFSCNNTSRVLKFVAYFIPNKEAIEGEKPKPSPRFMQHEAQNEARAISINKQIRAATRPQHIVP